MGEIAEDMRNGTLCQSCGVLNEELEAHLEKHAPGGGEVTDPWEPPGYPWTCSHCSGRDAASC